jgi:hypothetical protein
MMPLQHQNEFKNLSLVWVVTYGQQPRQYLSLAKNIEAYSKDYRLEGTGIPPKIRINSTTTIIPVIINGTRTRKIARITIAISAIINKVSVDP